MRHAGICGPGVHVLLGGCRVAPSLAATSSMMFKGTVNEVVVDILVLALTGFMNTNHRALHAKSSILHGFFAFTGWLVLQMDFVTTRRVEDEARRAADSCLDDSRSQLWRCRKGIKNYEAAPLGAGDCQICGPSSDLNTFHFWPRSPDSSSATLAAWSGQSIP